ncbi:unnamed protein product [Arctogadus glacialis]
MQFEPEEGLQMTGTCDQALAVDRLPTPPPQPRSTNPEASSHVRNQSQAWVGHSMLLYDKPSHARSWNN